MTTVARRHFRSVPYRDASATWVCIVELLTAGGNDETKRQELMSIAGVASSVIADQGPHESPIVITCDGPRTRIYCSYNDDALDDSTANEAKLGFDALRGEWQVSLPVAEEDLAWVKRALQKSSSRVVARDKNSGIGVDQGAQSSAVGTFVLDVERFLKS